MIIDAQRAKGQNAAVEATFCYVAFMHSENVEMVEESCLGLLRAFLSDESVDLPPLIGVIK